jgi:hypothetical protein
MANAFSTPALLEAFDLIGAAAVTHGQTLEFAVYGGSALMLASNFRFSSEDVDIAPLKTWPDWLHDSVATIARQNGWSRDWLNEAVGVFLSQTAAEGDHVLYGTFPRRSGKVGLKVFVPTAPYMLALKLKALRVLDPGKGEQETADIAALMRVCGLSTADEAVSLLSKYFPVSAAAPEKLRFLIRHILTTGETPDGAPEYPRAGR